MRVEILGGRVREMRRRRIGMSSAPFALATERLDRRLGGTGGCAPERGLGAIERIRRQMMPDDRRREPHVAGMGAAEPVERLRGALRL